MGTMIDNPRIDLLVARYGRALLVALAVCGVVALALSGWAVASPETTTTTQQTGSDRVSTEVGTEATVEAGGLWPAGTVLEDEPVYLTNATETLTLTPRTTVPTDGTTVYHDIALRYEAVRDGAAFWNETTQLSRQVPRVTDGVASSSVDIDVAAVRERMGEIEREVGGVGDVRVVAVVETEYDTGTTADAFTVETEL